MKNIFILLLLSFFIFGCAASASKMNGLNLGMTKDRVLQVMGEPGTTSESQGILYLKYKLRNGLIADDYYVRLVGGKVDAYGRFGEFNLGY